MYVHTDDDLARIDRTYLGPKGRRLPWTATYRTYGIFFVVGLVMFALLYQAGVNMLNLWGWYWWGLITFLVVRFLNRRLRSDVGLIANARSVAQEVSVPRDDPRPAKQSDMSLSIPFHADRDAAPQLTRRGKYAARVLANTSPLRDRYRTIRHRTRNTRATTPKES